ncbi:MAG: ankyrin repeat domain-containing protein [Acidobacteriota bacterium]
MTEDPQRFRDGLLRSAAGNGEAEKVTGLLAAGADPNARNRKRGDTALHLAVLSNSPRTVELLLEAGASHAAESRGGFTPLTLAFSDRKPGVAEVLLQRLDLGPEELADCLRWAILSLDPEGVDLLLGHGASPDTLNPRVETLLTGV